MKKQSVYQIVESILLIIVGVLIACSIIQQSILEYLLATAILVFGLFLVVRSLLLTRSITLLLPLGILGAVLVGLGIAIFAKYMTPVAILIQIIIVAITTIGALFIVDSLIRFVRKNYNVAIAELVIGLILLAFGLMFILWDDFRTYLWVIFGVLLAIYGVYCLIITLIKLKK
ncbi:MAG: hypothetical protein SO232_03270 [Candidatus Onthovivens sp.]|nr:hypothetical protein [Candidatus Onthovivens sp.]